MKKTILNLVFLFVVSSVLSQVIRGPVLIQGDVEIGSRDSSTVAIIFDRTGLHVNTVFGKAIDSALVRNPDLILMVGDCIEGGTDNAAVLDVMWQEFDSILNAKNARPIFYTCPGNHDVFDNVSNQLNMFNQRYGAEFKKIQLKNIDFFMLDNARWFTDSTNYLTQTNAIDTQMTWLSDELQASTAEIKILMMHKPFWDWHIDTLATSQLIENCAFQDTVVKYGVDGIYTGHYHNYHFDTYDGIDMVIGGRSGGGTTLGNPEFTPHDADYVAPSNETHKILILTITDHISYELVVLSTALDADLPSE